MPLQRHGAIQTYHMGSKRRNSRSYSRNVKSRISRVPRPIRTSPEIKTHTAGILISSLAAGSLINFDLTSIAEGPGDNQRIGKDIVVTGVDLQGYIGGNGTVCDYHLLTPKGNTNPVITDFVSAIGSPVSGDFHRPLWHSTGGNTSNTHEFILLKYRPKFPMRVLYNDTTANSGERNRLILTIVNNFSANMTGLSMTFRVYYQDP